jgi:hypothetical protein
MDQSVLFKKLRIRPLVHAELDPALEILPDCRETPYWADNKPEFMELTGRYGDLLRKGHTAPTEISLLGPRIGYGLFSAADLPAGTLVGEYAGIIRRARPLPVVALPFGRHATDYAWDYPETGGGLPPLEINAFRAGNALRFVNHGFEPNCATDHTEIDGRWVIFFRTLADIPAGRQLTVDYGEEYWTCRQRTLVLFGE